MALSYETLHGKSRTPSTHWNIAPIALCFVELLIAAYAKPRQRHLPPILLFLPISGNSCSLSNNRRLEMPKPSVLAEEQRLLRLFYVPENTNSFLEIKGQIVCTFERRLAVHWRTQSCESRANVFLYIPIPRE